MRKLLISFGCCVVGLFHSIGLAQNDVFPLIDSPGNTIGSDFNGDGIHDFIVGADGYDTTGTNREGAAYVFFGANSLSSTIDIGGAQSPDFTVIGKTADDQLGLRVASTGDINGDGIDDIIVGAHLNDDGTGDNGGAAYVFFGSITLSGTQNLGGVQSADITILGKADGDNLGRGVASVGDINGDGFDDFSVGASLNQDVTSKSGAAYVFFGASDISGTKDLGGAQSADITILGKATDNYIGFSISSAGDVNSDGFDDMVLGAFKNGDGGAQRGAMYIFYGSASLSGTKNLSTTASADVTILGKVDSDTLGRSVSGAGDVNGDGFDDFLVAADGNDEGGGANAGAAYVFFGASNLSGTKNLGGADSADFTVLGKGGGDYLGFPLSNAGDVNDDGFDDILLGAYSNDDGAGNAGAAYILFGASALSGTKNLGGAQSADVTILGKGGNDFLGRAVSGLGDVNDDGIPDVIVGAHQNNDGGSNNEGAAYILYGATNISGTKDTASSDEDVRILGESASDYLGHGVGGGRGNPGP